MDTFAAISDDTLLATWSRSTACEGLIAMIAIAICLVLGQVTGHAAAGAIAAGGALTAGFAVFNPALDSALISMVLCTLGLATATFAGSLSARSTVAVLIVVAIGGLNYGLLSGLGVTAGWIAQQSAVYLVIATYFPNGPRFAAGRASMILLGGLLQVLIHAGSRLHREGARSAEVWKGSLARLRSYTANLPRHMAWGSESLAYAAKLVATMVIATAIYRTLHLANGYWIPMTAVIVLKPQWTGTFSRGIARVLGTLCGVTIALGLAHIPHFPLWLVGVLVVAAAFACYTLQAVNYALFAVSITLYVVFLFRFGGFSETRAAHLRLVNTAIGGGLALLADSLWYGVSRLLGLSTTQMHPTDPNAGPTHRPHREL